jgi:adenylate cyclase
MRNFLNELKRRNVFKVGASYAIVSWIALQVADTVFPALNVPAWVLSLLAVLLLLGLPVALFLAWAFELTPDGIKPTRITASALALGSG